MSYRDLDRPPLDARALQAALVSPGGFWTDIVVTSSTASTNADLAEVARAGAAEGTVHTTDHQVAGRGRLDRSWDSPEASGIAVSVLLRPIEVPAGRWVWLPLLVGLAVAATVEECGVQAQLKWPNDVQVDGRKVAGILVEGRPQEGWAVLGVGLNVAVRPDDLPAELRETAAGLGLDPRDVEPTLRRVLDRLAEALALPPAELLDAWRARDALQGRRITWNRGQGTAAGLDGEGRLIVELDDGGRATLDAGEVHLGAP
jgi:BirA family biotin operon repressor/biotin-[acetyl-CoA-carboxylase] ligase